MTAAKKNKSGIECRTVRRRGRSGWLLANEQVALCCLRGGGHLESLCLRKGPAPNVNLLWESNWQTIEPQRYSEKRHGRRYGFPPAGKYLSGYTGHSLCIDYFGAPSEEETLLGLPLHGEVACNRWTRVKEGAQRGLGRLRVRSAAPSAGLIVQRDITLREGESVAYVTETITNKTTRDRYFQWAQHTTFGPPFLQAGESVCLMPGTRSKTWPLGYEGKGALENDREFAWPNAPANNGQVLDISRPFTTNGRGFIATTLLAEDRDSQLAYVAVLNWRLGLLAGYCFRRSDFPWVANWEENCARTDAPWGGNTQARGLEFATSPMPLGLRDAILSGPLFGVPAVRCLPARGLQAASYAIFVTQTPHAWRTITGIGVRGNALVVTGPNPEERIELTARGLKEISPDQESRPERLKARPVPQGGTRA
ncbi:MAG: hypothetical protein WA192_09700 [Candidatus Acidiferrales bacterium]